MKFAFLFLGLVLLLASTSQAQTVFKRPIKDGILQSDLDAAGYSISDTGTIVLQQRASAPSNPAASKIAFYAKNDGKLYTKLPDGTETEVGSGGGSSLPADPAAPGALINDGAGNLSWKLLAAGGGSVTDGNLIPYFDADGTLTSTLRMFVQDPDFDGIQSATDSLNGIWIRAEKYASSGTYDSQGIFYGDGVYEGGLQFPINPGGNWLWRMPKQSGNVVVSGTTGTPIAASSTLTASAPVSINQIWNSGATTFTALKTDITDTASAAASLLMDLQVGTASKFSVRKDGITVIQGPTSSDGNAIFTAKGGTGNHEISIRTVDASTFGGAYVSTPYLYNSVGNFYFQGSIYLPSNGSGLNFSQSSLTSSSSTGTVLTSGGSTSLYYGTTLETGNDATYQGPLFFKNGADQIVARLLPGGEFAVINPGTYSGYSVGAGPNWEETTTLQGIKMLWSSNVAYLGTGGGQAGGTARDLVLMTDDTERLRISSTGTLTFPDDVTVTFNPGSTYAGLNVGSLAGDPSTPANGDIWYDSTANELTARINGSNVALGAGGGGGVALGDSPTWTGVHTWTPAANTTPINVSGYSVTGSGTSPMLDLAGTWNTTGAPTALKLNVTNTASDAASLLMNLQVGGSSKMSVDKAGNLQIAGTNSYTSPMLRLGGATTGISSISTNRLDLVVEGVQILTATKYNAVTTDHNFAAPRIIFDPNTLYTRPMLEQLDSSDHAALWLTQLGANTGAMKLHLTNTYTDGTTYERGTLGWDGANAFTLSTSAGASGGAERRINISPGGDRIIQVAETGDHRQVAVGDTTVDPTYGMMVIADSTHSFKPALRITKATWGAGIDVALSTESAVISASGGNTFADYDLSLTGTYLQNAWFRGIDMNVTVERDVYGVVGVYGLAHHSLTAHGSNSNLAYGGEFYAQSDIADSGTWGAAIKGGANSPNVYGLQLIMNGSQTSYPLTIQTSGGTDRFAVNKDGNVLMLSGTSAAEFRLYEPSGSGTNYTGFKSPALAADLLYTLPTADGSNGDVLTTNGSKVLSWTTPAGSGDMTKAIYDADTNNVIDTGAGGTGATSLVNMITNQTSAGALAGTEEVLINASSTAKKTTTQAIADLAGAASGPVVDVFTADGTWTKPSGAKYIEVILVGGGGGGGSGRRGADSSSRYGGGGGAGGTYVSVIIDPAQCSATESVTVAAGGTGGAAVTADDTIGNNGTPGGTSLFGALVSANGGDNGDGGGTGATAGGTAITNSGGNQPLFTSPVGTGGGSGGLTNGGAGTNASTSFVPTGGGGGGGINSSNTRGIGASGGGLYPSPVTNSTSYASGNTSTTAGTAGAAGLASPFFIGTGGSGGSPGDTAGTIAGGAGGAGGNYGAGGGGGGASTNGANSGAGGNGASGIVIVKTYR